jgi:hypothetical protein
MLGQQVTPQPPIKVEGIPEYVVKKLLTHDFDEINWNS